MYFVIFNNIQVLEFFWQAVSSCVLAAVGRGLQKIKIMNLQKNQFTWEIIFWLYVYVVYLQILDSFELYCDVLNLFLAVFQIGWNAM